MRLQDLSDYLRLRRLTENPWEVLRFRNTQSPDRELVVRTRGGEPFFIRGGLSEYHLFHQEFVEDEHRLDSLRPGCWECVVDVGAKVGFFSIRAARLARRVIAYEPYPRHFEQLRRNVARLNVEAVQAAVADEDGVRRLFRSRSSQLTGSQPLLPERDMPMSEEFDEIETISLPTLFARHKIERCDLLKIDVEGSEYDIIYGIPDETLRAIQRICCEYHGIPLNEKGCVKMLVEHLRLHGFEVHVDPHARRPNRGILFATRPDED